MSPKNGRDNNVTLMKKKSCLNYIYKKIMLIKKLKIITVSNALDLHR